MFVPDTAFLILSLTVIFLATLLRAMVGFGDALIAMPILSLALGPRVAAPLVAILSLANALAVFTSGRRAIAWRSALLLVAASLVAIPLGVWFLHHAQERLVKVLLALVIGGFVVWRLRKPGGYSLRNDSWAPIAGFVAGLLGGAYNTNGPPIVAYGTMRGWSPETFRATLQAYFLPTGVLTVGCHIWYGGLDVSTWQLFACGVPLVALAHYLGRRWGKYVPVERFSQIIQFTLAGVSLLMIWDALRG